MNLLDAYGRPVVAGDKVVITGISTPVLQVLDVKPDLRASTQMPNGPMLQVTVGMKQTIVVPPNTSITELLLVLQRPEAPKPTIET